jgi:hypothetical protein
VDDLSSGDLTIEVTERDGALVCTWTGKSNERHPQKTLGPWFEGLLADAAGRSAGVEMHFERLEHFNSSTITALVRLIQTARHRAVRLTFVYDQDLKWQQLSFDALRVFDKGDRAFVLESA